MIDRRIKKRRSRKAYITTMTILITSAVLLITLNLILIKSVNEKKVIYDEYQRKVNIAKSEKNFDEKTADIYKQVQENSELVNDLKAILGERQGRREEVKAEASERTNEAAEAEAEMERYKKLCGFTTYDELLKAYNEIITQK